MEANELRELMTMLHEGGMNPMLCAKAVPVSRQSVKCGMPGDIYDQEIDAYVCLPKSVVGTNPEMMIPASGNSMIEAGYEDGDLLRVRFGVSYRDLDDVLVMVDGLCTVKTLVTDEQGQKWLVPRNPTYRAIPLSDDQDVRVLGVVVGVQKRSPRASLRDVMNTVRRTKDELKSMRRLSDEEVDDCLVAIGSKVKHARQWYAVMRMLVDCHQMREDDYAVFCQRVERMLPDHGHLPVAKEIGRMAVLSFAKPVALWVEANAPVRGARFNDYMDIAMRMQQLLNDARTQKNSHP